MANEIPYENTGSVERTQMLKRFFDVKWIAATILLFFLFTLFKIPTKKINGWIQGKLDTSLGEMGITVTSREADISFLFGPKYEMHDVTLFPPPPAAPMQIPVLTVSPSWSNLLKLKLGATLKITMTEGGNLSISGAMGSNQKLSISINADSVDMSKITVLPAILKVTLHGIVDGTIQLDGQMADPKSFQGKVQLELKKLKFPEQSISTAQMPITLPEITVSEAQIEMSIDGGVANIDQFTLGKKTNTQDDMIGKVTGKITIANPPGNSSVDITALFSLSEKIKKGQPFFDLVLNGGKQADGSYSWKANGPMNGPPAFMPGAASAQSPSK